MSEAIRQRITKSESELRPNVIARKLSGGTAAIPVVRRNRSFLHHSDLQQAESRRFRLDQTVALQHVSPNTLNLTDGKQIMKQAPRLQYCSALVSHLEHSFR